MTILAHRFTRANFNTEITDLQCLSKGYVFAAYRLRTPHSAQCRLPTVAVPNHEPRSIFRGFSSATHGSLRSLWSLAKAM